LGPRRVGAGAGKLEKRLLVGFQLMPIKMIKIAVIAIIVRPILRLTQENTSQKVGLQ
jgi:hypothetical protein